LTTPPSTYLTFPLFGITIEQPFTLPISFGDYGYVNDVGYEDDACYEDDANNYYDYD